MFQNRKPEYIFNPSVKNSGDFGFKMCILIFFGGNDFFSFIDKIDKSPFFSHHSQLFLIWH